MGDDTIKDIDAWIASLPDPEKDKMPPHVSASREDIFKSIADEEYEAQFINIPKFTEERAKYILCDSPLIGANLRKDGDWITKVSGRQVYQKKTADFVGGVPLAGINVNAHLYVEVKSIAPYRTFSLARLDRPNRKGGKSQQEKLTMAMEDGALVWLFIGVWDTLPGREPVIENRKGRKYTRWRKIDVKATYYLVEWRFWLEKFLPSLGKRRTFGRNDLGLLEHCKIYKEGRQWKLHSHHWVNKY